MRLPPLSEFMRYFGCGRGYFRSGRTPAIFCLSACIIFSAIAGPAAAAGRYDKLLGTKAGRDKLAALAAMEDSRNASGIDKYIKDVDPLIRLRCAEVLGRIGSAGSVGMLASLAQDTDAAVANAAVYSLGLTMSESALDPLEKALKGGSNEMKMAALEALGISRVKKASPIIAPMLTHFHAAIRERAAVALAVLGDSSAAEEFAASIHDPDPDLIAQTVYALGRLGCGEFNDRIEDLLEHENHWVVMRAAEALGRLRDKGAVDKLETLLKNEDRIIRIKTAEALSRIGNNDAAKALEGVLGSDDPYIKDLALRGIAAAGRDESFDLVAPLLGDGSQMVRRSAIEAAASTDPERAHPLLLEIVRTGGAYDRMAALEFIGQIAYETDLNLLVETLESSYNHLEREGAAAGLKRLENEEFFLLPVGDPGRTPLDALLAVAGGDDPVVGAMAVEALPPRLAKASVARLAEIFRGSQRREDCDRKLAIIALLEDVAYEDDLEPAAGAAAIDLLKEASGSGDPRIADAAAGAARLYGEKIEAHPGGTGAWQRGRYPWGEPSLPLGTRNIVITTPKGRIEIELFGDEAPIMVKSILTLAEEGFYNGLKFHRVVPGFVIQGGCPRGDGWGDAGYFLRSQFNSRSYERGTVGMAHSGKDTPGSQFFITQLPQPHLNGRYTVIGRVVKGMDVVDRIEAGDTFGVSVVR